MKPHMLLAAMIATLVAMPRAGGRRRGQEGAHATGTAQGRHRVGPSPSALYGHQGSGWPGLSRRHHPRSGTALAEKLACRFGVVPYLATGGSGIGRLRGRGRVLMRTRTQEIRRLPQCLSPACKALVGRARRIKTGGGGQQRRAWHRGRPKDTATFGANKPRPSAYHISLAASTPRSTPCGPARPTRIASAANR